MIPLSQGFFWYIAHISLHFIFLSSRKLGFSRYFLIYGYKYEVSLAFIDCLVHERIIVWSVFPTASWKGVLPLLPDFMVWGSVFIFLYKINLIFTELVALPIVSRMNVPKDAGFFQVSWDFLHTLDGSIAARGGSVAIRFRAKLIYPHTDSSMSKISLVCENSANGDNLPNCVALLFYL